MIQDPEGPPLAYSIASAAKVVDVSPRTVWRLIKDRELATFKLGARTLIRADVLRAFIDSISSP